MTLAPCRLANRASDRTSTIGACVCKCSPRGYAPGRTATVSQFRAAQRVAARRPAIADQPFAFFLEHVGAAFQEQHAEDVVLVASRLHLAAQDVRRRVQVPLQLRSCQLGQGILAPTLEVSQNHEFIPPAGSSEVAANPKMQRGRGAVTSSMKRQSKMQTLQRQPAIVAGPRGRRRQLSATPQGVRQGTTARSPGPCAGRVRIRSRRTIRRVLPGDLRLPRPR